MSRAHGIDISKYQVNFDATVNPGDINFVIMRISYAMMADERYDGMIKAIQPVPIRGAYHYFSSGSPWRMQADNFLSLAKGMGFHFYALDIEEAYNKQSADFAGNARKWIQYVADETGQRVLLYTNLNIYNTWLRPFGDWMRQWPLWIAQYWDPPSRDKNPALPQGVPDGEWTIWQYSADTPPNNLGAAYGVSSPNIDLDVYNGTVAQMREWLRLEPSATVKPVKEAVDTKVQIDDLDYDLLAKKLAPLVAPLVAEEMKKMV
jgi:GH25 family lysozyme M1 (1,4-beta-N-acetylmuramidase)